MRRVSPDVYTEKYYLTDCTGYEEFKKTFGTKLEPRLKELIKYLEINPKNKVLDIGCGRGEMILYAAKNSAIGYGIDYSKEAIKLANKLKTKQKPNIQKKMSFSVMDAKKLSFQDSSFDLVIMTDVFEHLYPEELEVVFGEIRRVLKNNGRLVLHTAPNRLFNDYVYRYYSYPFSSLIVFVWNIMFKNAYPNIAHPNSLRSDSHHIMHINEPTFFSIKSLLKKHNFNGKLFSSNVTVKKEALGIKDKLFNFLVYLHPLSMYFPLNTFFGSDFIAIVKKS